MFRTLSAEPYQRSGHALGQRPACLQVWTSRLGRKWSGVSRSQAHTTVLDTHRNAYCVDDPALQDLRDQRLAMFPIGDALDTCLFELLCMWWTTAWHAAITSMVSQHLSLHSADADVLQLPVWHHRIWPGHAGQGLEHRSAAGSAADWHHPAVRPSAQQAQRCCPCSCFSPKLLTPLLPVPARLYCGCTSNLQSLDQSCSQLNSV